MIQQKLGRIKEFLGEVQLVAVSKLRSSDEIMSLYQEGQRVFAENRVQALLERQAELPNDIRWHLIGHLQRNKVKYVAPFVEMIQSVDSLRLLEEINKQAEKHERNIPVLLQVHIAQEEHKFGFAEAEIFNLIDSGIIASLKHITIRGLMGMATLTDDKNQISQEFKSLKDIHKRVVSQLKPNDPLSETFTELSMGMSSDYKLAIEEGSTMVRIGSALFG